VQAETIHTPAGRNAVCHDHVRLNTLDDVICIDARLHVGTQLRSDTTHTTQPLQQRPAFFWHTLHVQLSCTTKTKSHAHQ
jgi:hypothetical protein